MKHLRNTLYVTALFCAPLCTVGCGDATPEENAEVRGTLTLPRRACVVNFEATVRSGPSAGTELIGYAVFQADATGALTSSVMRTTDGTSIPVTGQITGRDVSLRFDLGGGRAVQGTGTLASTLRECRGEMRGPLTGPMPGDTGDWLGGDGDVVFVKEGDGEVALGEESTELARIGGGGVIPSFDAGGIVPISDASIVPVADAAFVPAPDAGSPAPTGTGSSQNVSTPAGVLFISVPSQHVILRASSAFAPLTVWAGATNQPGNINGTRAAARFNNPTGIAYDNVRSALLVADTNNQQVRRISTLSNSVTTVVTRPAVSAASVAAGFAPINNFVTRGVAVSPQGAIVVSDASNHCVWRLNGNTLQTTLLAGRPLMPGSSDGVGTNARFNAPGQAMGGVGGEIIAVSEVCRVRLIELPSGMVSTIGSAGCP